MLKIIAYLYFCRLNVMLFNVQLNFLCLVSSIFVFKGTPSAVQIYRMNNSYLKTFDADTLLTFVCEQGINTVVMGFIYKKISFNFQARTFFD